MVRGRLKLLIWKMKDLDNISVDKMTLNDRAQWTFQNADRIIKWAEEDALQRKAEKPYIFLACCYEWQNIEVAWSLH